MFMNAHNLASDGTIRLWDIEHMEDKLQIQTFSDNVRSYAMSFNYEGSQIMSTFTNGMTAIYDIRSRTCIGDINNTARIALKPTNVTCLSPDKYFVQTAFDKEGKRTILLWDQRSLTAPVQEIVAKDKSVAGYTPFYDSCLPLLYLSCKGEGFTVYEFDGGSLHLVDDLKVDHPVTSADLMPKFTCGSNSELARFIHLGTDNAIRSTSVLAPKLNADTVFYEEIYPDIPIPDVSLNIDTWLQNDKKEFYPKRAPYKEMAAFCSRPIPFESNGTNPYSALTTVDGKSFRKVTTTIESCTKSFMDLPASSTLGHSIAGLNSSTASVGISETSFEDHLLIEKKGWIRSDWVRHHVSVKRSGIYTFNVDNMEKAIETIPIPQIRSADNEANTLHPIFTITTIGGKRIRFSGPLVTAFMSSINTIRSAIQSQKGFRGVIMGQCSILLSESQTWTPKIISLNDEGFIQVFPNDMKFFISGKANPDSVHLSTLETLYHLALTENDSTTPRTLSEGLLLLRFPNNVTAFKFKQDADIPSWIDEIKAVIQKNQIEPACGHLSYSVIDIRCTILSMNGFHASASHQTTITNKRLYLISFNGELRFYHHPWDAQSVFQCSVNKLSWTTFIHTNDTEKQATVLLDDGRKVVMAFDNESERSRFLYELKQLYIAVFDLHDYLKLGNISELTHSILSDKLKDFYANTENGKVYVGTAHIIRLDLDSLNKGIQDTKALVQVCSGQGIQMATGYIPIHSSLIQNDACYVLDEGNTITHWNENDASRLCRAKAMEIAGGIRKSRQNKPKVVLIEDDLIKIKKKLESNPVQSHVKRSFHDLSLMRIYKVMNPDTSIRDKKRVVDMVFEGFRSPKSILTTNECFIVETRYEVFIWHGKGSGKWQRLYANYISLALAMSKTGHVIWAKMDEALEDLVFKDKFLDFGGFLPISMSVQEQKGNIATALVQEKIDVDALLNGEIAEQVISLPSDKVTKSVQFFSIQDFKRYPFEFKGELYQDQSYVIMEIYSSQIPGMDKAICYFWQGSKSTISDKGTSALMTIELSDLFQGDTVHIRVVEGKEPNALLDLFSNKTILIKRPISVEEPTLVYDIRAASNKGHYRIYELDQGDFVLNEFECAILPLQSEVFLWKGRYASKELETRATRFLNELGYDRFTCIDETNPVPAALESVANYQGTTSSMYRPRLFNVNGATGIVQIHRVPDFTQDDLNVDQVMVLDALDKIYIWFGDGCKLKEKIFAIETFREYILKSPVHRPICKMVVVYCFKEPKEFIRVFHGWNDSQWDKERRLKLEKAGSAMNLLGSQPILNTSQPVETIDDSGVIYDQLTRKTYSAQVLLSGSLPENVDPTKLDEYLNEEEFEKIFRMKRRDYQNMKPWKKEEIRKKVGFY